MTQAKSYISASQMASYARCPEAYRRAYIDGERIPPGIALLKGRGFHGAAETNNRQKIDTHVDIPLEDFRAAAAAAFQTEVEQQGVTLTDDEQARGQAIVLGEALDATVDMAEAHGKLQAPEYQPVAVERSFRIKTSGERDLLGIIDLVDDQDRVTDFKTASRKKPQSDADDSLQLTVYAAGFHALSGKPPVDLRLDSIVKTKTRTDRQLLSTVRAAADFAALAYRINAVVSAIGAGIFPPTSPDDWVCSPRFCGFWNTCPYVNSERKEKAK